jgi:hypothetical protein
VTLFPFAGVVTPRPYPPTGLTTARWKSEVPVRTVRFADLWLTQPAVVTLALFGHTDRVSDSHPHVVRWQGICFLEDGHNRLVRAALQDGAHEADVRVFDIP